MSFLAPSRASAVTKVRSRLKAVRDQHAVERIAMAPVQRACRLRVSGVDFQFGEAEHPAAARRDPSNPNLPARRLVLAIPKQCGRDRRGVVAVLRTGHGAAISAAADGALVNQAFSSRYVKMPIDLNLALVIHLLEAVGNLF